mgnify:FL=1
MRGKIFEDTIVIATFQERAESDKKLIEQLQSDLQTKTNQLVEYESQMKEKFEELADLKRELKYLKSRVEQAERKNLLINGFYSLLNNFKRK